MGIGIAMTMPTTASTAMGSVSPDKAGIASGVVNASRQVGGALGVAVLGTVAATARRQRVDRPPGAVALVTGGQGTKIYEAAITRATRGRTHLRPRTRR